MRHRRAKLPLRRTLTTTLVLLLVSVDGSLGQLYRHTYAVRPPERRNRIVQLSFISQQRARVVNTAQSNTRPNQNATHPSQNETQQSQNEVYLNQNRVYSNIQNGNHSYVGVTQSGANNSGANKSGTNKSGANEVGTYLNQNMANLNNQNEAYSNQNWAHSNQNWAHSNQNEVPMNQNVGKLDVECAYLTQPLQSVVAAPIHDDIFTQCSNICSMSIGGDLILLSIVGQQVTCGCSFVNSIALKVNLTDNDVCDVRCGGSLDLPCGSSTSPNAVSMYSLPSIISHLQTSKFDQGSPRNSENASNKKNASRNTAGIAVGTAVGLLVLFCILGFLGWKLMKRKNIKKDESFMNAYNSAKSASSLRSMNSSFVYASKKQNFSDISKGDNFSSQNVSPTFPDFGKSSNNKEDLNVGSSNTIKWKPSSVEAPSNKSNDGNLLGIVKEAGFFEDSVVDTIARNKNEDIIASSTFNGNGTHNIGENDIKVEDTPVRTDMISRALQNTTLSRPAAVNKKFQAATLPKRIEEAATNTDGVAVPQKKFQSLERSSKSKTRIINNLNKSVNAFKSSHSKDKPNVMTFNNEFVVPTNYSSNENALNDDFLKSYKEKLRSESHAFDAAFRSDDESDNRGKNNEKTLKLTPIQQLQATSGSNRVNMNLKYPRTQLIYNASQDAVRTVIPNGGTLNKTNNFNKDSNHNVSTPIQSKSSSSETPINSPMLFREPSINFETPTEDLQNQNIGTVSHSHQTQLQNTLSSKKRISYGTNTNEDGEIIKRKKDPKRISLSKSKFKYTHKNPIVSNKKGKSNESPSSDTESDVAGKRDTYLSKKLKKIQLKPESSIEGEKKSFDIEHAEELDSNNDNNDNNDNNNRDNNGNKDNKARNGKNATISIFQNYQMISDGESNGLDKDESPNQINEDTGDDGEKRINNMDALAEMGIVDKSIFSRNDDDDLGILDDEFSKQSSTDSNEIGINIYNIDHDPNTKTRDNAKEKSFENKTNRWSTALSSISESLSKRSSNVRDSLIKKLKEGVMPYNFKGNSSRNSHGVSQNDHLTATNEADSKQ